MSFLGLSRVSYRLAPSFSLLPRDGQSFWGEEEEEDTQVSFRLWGKAVWSSEWHSHPPDLPGRPLGPPQCIALVPQHAWAHRAVSAALCFCSSVLHGAWVALGGCSSSMPRVNTTTAPTPGVTTEGGTDPPRGDTNPVLPLSVAVTAWKWHDFSCPLPLTTDSSHPKMISYRAILDSIQDAERFINRHYYNYRLFGHGIYLERNAPKRNKKEE